MHCLPGHLDLDPLDVFQRRMVGGLFEAAHQVAPAHIHTLCHLLDTEILRVMYFDIELGLEIFAIVVLVRSPEHGKVRLADVMTVNGATNGDMHKAKGLTTCQRRRQ